jgi:hypothetical protein
MKDPFQRRDTPPLVPNGGTQYVLRVDCNRRQEEYDRFLGHVLALSSDVQSIKSVVEKLEDVPTMLMSIRDHLVEIDKKILIQEKIPDLVKDLSNKTMALDVSVKKIEGTVEEQEEVTGDIQIETAVVHRRVSDMTDLSKRKVNWLMTGLVGLVIGIATTLFKMWMDLRKATGK